MRLAGRGAICMAFRFSPRMPTCVCSRSGPFPLDFPPILNQTHLHAQCLSARPPRRCFDQPCLATVDRVPPEPLGVIMPEATFWFASPFREWIGQRTLTIRWDGRITLREVFERLAAEHVRLRTNLKGTGLQQESFNNLAAIMLDGDFLALDAVIPDGARVDVFTPLAGGGDAASLPRLAEP